MPSFDLMTYPDFPVLVARWGIWFLAALTLLGSETVVALAGFLCWIGILQALQSFTAAFLAAFAADVIFYFAFRNRADSPVARFFVSQTLLERRLPLYRETLPAVLFYRFLPQKKARFPLLAAQSPTLTSVPDFRRHWVSALGLRHSRDRRHYGGCDRSRRRKPFRHLEPPPRLSPSDDYDFSSYSFYPVIRNG